MKMLSAGFGLGAGMIFGMVGGVMLVGAMYIGYCKVRNMINERKGADTEQEAEA